MIIGIAGACRREDEELTNMLLKDIDDKNTMLVVNIPNTKTNVKRTFVAVSVESLIFFREYVALSDQWKEPEGGGNITNLKRHGRWKSSSVSEGYIEDSMKNKIQIANRIQNGNSTDATSPNLSFSTSILKSTSINNKAKQLQKKVTFPIL